jgi:hypothetical protein
MARNLIDVLEQMLGSNEVLSRIGALIGLSPERVKGAIGAAVPAILAGLAGAAQTARGRDQLAGLTHAQDISLLDNITGALGGGNERSLIDTGSGMLSSLLGQGKLDALSGAIGKFAGISQSSTGSLLAALAPVVMGTVAREQRSQGLDAEGLAGMLSDQKDHIARALPAGLASSLGSAGLLEGIADRLGQAVSATAQTGRATAAEAGRAASVAATTAAGMAGSAASAARSSSGSMTRWVVGAVVVLAALWAGYHFLSRSERVQQAADKAAGTAAQVGESAKNLMVGDVDLSQQTTGVFEDATKALNDVTDSASAELAVPKLNDVNDSLSKLGGLVDQLPAEGKSALAALIAGVLPKLEALIAKVNDIPGAKEVIGPIADSMLEKLRAMTA